MFRPLPSGTGRQILRSFLSLIVILTPPPTSRTDPTSLNSSAERASPFPVVSFVYLTFFARVLLKLAAGRAAISCPFRLGHTDSIAAEAASVLEAVVNLPGRPLSLPHFKDGTQLATHHCCFSLCLQSLSSVLVLVPVSLSLSLCLSVSVCVSVRKSQLTVVSARAPRAQVCVFQTQNQKPQASQHLQSLSRLPALASAATSSQLWQDSCP